jgi:pyruvate dehydrogenase E1 component
LDQDRDPAETREWLDALDSVEAFEGIGRIDELKPAQRAIAQRFCAVAPFRLASGARRSR